MSSAENEAIARRYYEEGWNKHDLAVIDEVLATSYVGHSGGQDIVGPDAVKEAITSPNSTTAFPDATTIIEDLFSVGDKVVIRWTIQGTHTGEFVDPAVGRVAATGKWVTMAGIEIFRLAGGKIVESWNEGDFLGALQQIGAIPAPGQGTS